MTGWWNLLASLSFAFSAVAYLDEVRAAEVLIDRGRYGLGLSLLSFEVRP